MLFTGECYGGVCMVDLSVQARLPVGAEVPYIIGSSALLTLLVTGMLTFFIFLGGALRQ